MGRRFFFMSWEEAKIVKVVSVANRRFLRCEKAFVRKLRISEKAFIANWWYTLSM